MRVTARVLANRFVMLLGFAGTLAVLVVSGALATHGPEAETSEGSNDVVPLQNKQNEPIVGINPIQTDQISAGQNDNIDLEGCLNRSDNTCPFTPGVGLTGFEGSLNGGLTWNQPNYSGWSARACVGTPGPSDACNPSVGPIGTVPWYFEEGLVSNGDPVQTWGPQPGPAGFSWSNGSRLYYQDITTNFSAQRDEQAFRGLGAIGVSFTDDLPAALTDGSVGKNAWSRPVLISGSLSSTTFSDKNWMAADDAASSPFFGFVHACWVSFRSSGAAPEPVTYSRSTDGGVTWDAPKQLTSASNQGLGSGRQGCQVDTDSDGVVYVFYRGGDAPKDNPPLFNRQMLMIRSFDGGVKWERPRPVADVVECGLFDVAQGSRTFDGIAGARTNSFPSVSIANGAPLGNGPDTIVLSWCQGPTTTTGFGEQALVQWSTDKGETWSGPVDAAPAGDRPDFPAIAISPDGSDVYVTYMNFLQPWQSTTASERLMHGVVRHASVAGGVLGAFTDAHRGVNGDARGSSTNGLTAEFLGDYNSVDAENDFAYAVWNDVREAANCPTISTWRQQRVEFLLGTGPNPGPPPSVATCPATFGNSDIWGTRVVDPTP